GSRSGFGSGAAPARRSRQSRQAGQRISSPLVLIRIGCRAKRFATADVARFGWLDAPIAAGRGRKLLAFAVVLDHKIADLARRSREYLRSPEHGIAGAAAGAIIVHRQA